MSTRNLTILRRICFSAGATCAILGTSAANASVWATCKPSAVASFDTRFHIRCAVSVGAIAYFAIPAGANSDFYRASLAVANSALVTGKTIKVLYEPGDTSGAAFGCGASDCRKFTGLEMFE